MNNLICIAAIRGKFFQVSSYSDILFATTVGSFGYGKFVILLFIFKPIEKFN